MFKFCLKFLRNSFIYLISHFIELVYAADTLVGEDEGTSFKHHFTGQVVLHDGGSQTNAGRTTASCQPRDKKNYLIRA